MGLRRGILLGFLVGLIGVVLGRRTPADQEAGAEGAGAREPTRLDKARAAGREAAETTARKLRRRYDQARRRGYLPPDRD